MSFYYPRLVPLLKGELDMLVVGSRSMTASRGILSLFFFFFFLFIIILHTAEVIEKPRGVRKSAHTSRERERNWTIGHLNTHTRPLASSRSTAGFETYNLVEFAFGSRKKKKTTTTKEAMASSHGKYTPLDITDEEKNSKYNLPGSLLGF